MILRDVAIEYHDQAIKSGWYQDRDKGAESRLGMVALIHSELSEALECIRNNQWEEYRLDSNPHKPLGLPSEIADTVIRALDFMAYFNIKIIEPLRWEGCAPLKRWTPKKAAASIAHLHQITTDEDMNELVQESFRFARNSVFDLDAAIRTKAEYNTQRSFRHGGKTL